MAGDLGGEMLGFGRGDTPAWFGVFVMQNTVFLLSDAGERELTHLSLEILQELSGAVSPTLVVVLNGGELRWSFKCSVSHQPGSARLPSFLLLEPS